MAQSYSVAAAEVDGGAPGMGPGAVGSIAPQEAQPRAGAEAGNCPSLTSRHGDSTLSAEHVRLIASRDVAAYY